MRKIDKWVGIPLCFFFSIFNSLANAFSKKKLPDVSRTLFIELSEMGSAIIADPAMRKIQAEGGAELFFVIFKNNYKSLEILQTIPGENIFSMRTDGLFTLFAEVLKFMRWCRKNKITCTIDLELFSRFTALLGFFSGAATRVGFTNFHDEGLYRGNLINFPVRYNGHVHIAVNFISLVKRALNYFHNPYATVPLNPQEIILARAVVTQNQISGVEEKIKNLFPAWHDQKIILLNVNASDMLPQRRWQQENFAYVGRELLKQFQNIILIATGAPAERNYVQHVVDLIDDARCINTAGNFNFNELVPLYSLSTCMLTNDSGPAHFASVTSLKVFVLFGPETPALYLPLGGNAEPFYLGLPCSPCVSAANHRKTTCTIRPCITTIQPEWVTGRLINFLEQQKATQQEYG